jgi:hypothetical protein
LKPILRAPARWTGDSDCAPGAGPMSRQNGIRSARHATCGVPEPRAWCDLSWRRSRACRLCSGLPGHSVVRLDPRWRCSERGDESKVALCAVALSGFKPSRAFSCRLRPSKPTVPVWALLTATRRASDAKMVHVGLKPSRSSGERSPPAMTHITLGTAILSNARVVDEFRDSASL